METRPYWLRLDLPNVTLSGITFDTFITYTLNRPAGNTTNVFTLTGPAEVRHTRPAIDAWGTRFFGHMLNTPIAGTSGFNKTGPGTVSITQPGSSNATTIGTLQLAMFINPAGLQSLGENLYGETAASGTPSSNAPGSNGAGLLNQGYVETSNVNVVEELVNMIQTQRAYEINSKAITTSDQMLQKLTQL